MSASKRQPHFTSLEPGLMVIHGNRQEDLRDLLVAWLQRTPLQPLENEVMLVQSNGIAQWLKLALARPAQAGGLGISAAVDMQLPGRFLWTAYRAVLGEDAVPATSPFDKSRLVWRLLRLLPQHMKDPAFAPLRALLGDQGDDWRRLYRLAMQVADLFDQYQVFRADWLHDWEHRNDVLRDSVRHRVTELPPAQRWQPVLWRLLLDDVPQAQRDSHRAGVHRRFMQQMQSEDLHATTLPRRIVIFGMTSLPPQVVEALAAMARVSQILLLVTNPCRHYWADIIEDRELLLAEHRRHGNKPGLPPEPRYEDLHLHAHPLLAAWGKQGRDFLRQLDAFDQPERYRDHFSAIKRSIDLFQPCGNDTLLHQVQQAVLELEPSPVDRALRKPLPDTTSLHFHIAHSPQREVEILHDQLLALFEQAAREGNPLAPRDVMVMVPDIRSYAPHVQAVFGRIAHDDPRYLPYSVADQPGRGASPLLTALERLLSLDESRFTASDVLDLLDVPSLRRRFGVAEDSLPLLRRWIDESGIRWGLDGRQKQALGVPPDEKNSWRFGLRRMLLGYATGDGPSWGDIAPYPEIGGLDAELLGPLSHLLDTLAHYWRAFSTPATPVQWGDRLHRLLRECFDTRGDESDTMRIDRLDSALDTWLDACHEAGFAQPVPLSIVREDWLQAIDQNHLSQRFMGGAVNFGTLMPMRAIPFRVVCLLGMNDEDYPRRMSPPDFDLMAIAGQYRPGDRSRREDDRYMFLEALLSARDVLHVSWVGHSVRDNTQLPPSVLVGQLRDYLANGWHVPEKNAPDDESSRKHLLDAITTVHPLQPFSARYVEHDPASRLFTYASEWMHAHRPEAKVDATPLAPWQAESVLDIGTLQRFLARPVTCFYGERLNVRFENVDNGLEDDEPFALNKLEHYTATLALLQGTLTTNTPLADVASRMRQEGLLPSGGFGVLTLDGIGKDAQQVLQRWQAAAERWPSCVPPQELQHTYNDLTVEGWLDDLRSGNGSSLVRLLPVPSKLRKNGAIQYHRLLQPWVLQLMANAQGIAFRSRFFAPDATLTLNVLERDEATSLLNALLDAWKQGMQSPLPIACRTAYAWLLANGKKSPFDVARLCYEGGDAPDAPGEMHREPCLARTWRSFSALHADGFEHWLSLYRPLLDITELETDA